LDDWKETCVIYGLLDQNQPTQYIRIQKAFLGPQNAYEMAQQYDSINYVNTLSVRIERMSGNNVESTVILQPDTFYNKQPGDFYAPMYVVYSFDQAPGWFNPIYKYRLVVNNSATQNQSDATTHILENFDITYPSFGTVGFATNNVNYKVEVKWEGVRNARQYQLAMYFQYKETDINNNVTVKRTPAWVIGEVANTNLSSTQEVSYKFDPDGFYRFIGQQVQPDNNVLQRQSDSVIFVVYACGEELYDYMAINGPSTGIAQEKPLYTNINNGLGVFSSRTSTTRNFTIPNQSLDSLSRGRFTCDLKFLDHNGDNFGCQ
jgi:hypothetical protein